jgi:hypothetical protein
MQWLSKFFLKKLQVPPLVNPLEVEIDIFADLTVSKEAKSSIFAFSNGPPPQTLSVLCRVVQQLLKVNPRQENCLDQAVRISRHPLRSPDSLIFSAQRTSGQELSFSS